MNFTVPSSSVWVFVGDIDEASKVASRSKASATHSFPVHNRRASLDVRQIDGPAPAARARTLSADSNSWMRTRDANVAPITAGAINTKLIPRKSTNVNPFPKPSDSESFPASPRNSSEDPGSSKTQTSPIKKSNVSVAANHRADSHKDYSPNDSPKLRELSFPVKKYNVSVVADQKGNALKDEVPNGSPKLKSGKEGCPPLASGINKQNKKPDVVSSIKAVKSPAGSIESAVNAGKTGSNHSKPPRGPVSPKPSRRASADCGQASLDKQQLPLQSKAPVPRVTRRASTDSSSWQRARNVSVQGKKIDPQKDCALHSSFTDLKLKFTGTIAGERHDAVSKLDPKKECAFNSSVSDLKAIFNPTTNDDEPEEEPEFHLFDSPVREARKSVKILDAISQLGKASERTIPKIDPLDEIFCSSKSSLGSFTSSATPCDSNLPDHPMRERRQSANAISQLLAADKQHNIPKVDPLEDMLNNSKCSLGSFAKSSAEHEYGHIGEGSLTDIFEGETKENVESGTMKDPEQVSETEDSSAAGEVEEAVPALAQLSKAERRRRARMMWQSERSMNSSFMQVSPNESFIQNSPNTSLSAIS